MAGYLIRGRYVVADAATVSSGGLIEEGAVAVEGDSVAAVGRYDDLKARYPDAEEIGGEGHVVIPGLVNTHHHGWGLTSFELGFTDDYLEAWIIDIWQLKIVDAYLDTLWADMRNIRSGVTTLLHAAYGRDFGNYAGETRAKLRAHADSGIRAGYAVHTLDQHLFVYQDNADFLGVASGRPRRAHRRRSWPRSGRRPAPTSSTCWRASSPSTPVIRGSRSWRVPSRRSGARMTC